MIAGPPWPRNTNDKAHHRHSMQQDILINWSPQETRVAIIENGADRKSTRLNSSHLVISYAVFCLKKKKQGVRSPQALLATSDARCYPAAALAHPLTRSATRAH